MGAASRVVLDPDAVVLDVSGVLLGDLMMKKDTMNEYNEIESQHSRYHCTGKLCVE